MPRKNILVVDDEKSQREILELILAEEGYDVTTAASGEASLTPENGARLAVGVNITHRPPPPVCHAKLRR